MILDRGNESKPTSSSSNTALAATMTNACSNPNYKAKKCSTHTTANCYWPGGGKEGQFPPNFGQRSKANIVHTTYTDTTEYFVLSACIPVHAEDTISGVEIGEEEDISIDVDLSPRAFIGTRFLSFGTRITPTFMDSGASDTMFAIQEMANKNLVDGLTITGGELQGKLHSQTSNPPTF
jgi:hypothetical protein